MKVDTHCRLNSLQCKIDLHENQDRDDVGKKFLIRIN